MLKEGQVRIPSGCAISGIFSRSGRRISGEAIVKSISVMHDRSNGLGGGFAGYGIYPEYKDLYAFHVFYDTIEARERCAKFLDRHFDVVNLSKIPTKKHPRIIDEPLIWRYFVAPLPTKLKDSQLEEREYVSRCVIRINTELEGAYVFSSGKNTSSSLTPKRRTNRKIIRLPSIARGVLLDGPWPLSHQHAGMLGRSASLCYARLLHRT